MGHWWAQVQGSPAYGACFPGIYSLTEKIRHHTMGVWEKEESPPAGKESKEMSLDEVAFHLDLVSFRQTGMMPMWWEDFICLIMKCFLVEFG